MNEPRTDPMVGDAGRPRWSRLERLVERAVQWRSGVLALVLVLAPFAVAAVTVLADRDDTLIRDHALTELRVRDVGREPVLVGLYSRDTWSHPGPALFYTLALPYRLTGSNPSGLLLGALLVNAGAVAAMALLARRLAGPPAFFSTLVALAVLARALGPEFWSDPWVCYVTVLPFGLLCFLSWAMLLGEAWALPAAAAVGSWVVQAHVGYAPLTVVLLGAGAVGLVAETRRAHEPGRAKKAVRAAGAALVVVGVAWALPLYDQVAKTGNLGEVVDWFRRADEGTATLAEGLRVVFGQFALWPDWVTGQRRAGLINGATELQTTTRWPVLLLAFGWPAWSAYRRRVDRAASRFVIVVTLALVAAVASVARTVGIMYEYRLLWTWLLAALAVIAAVWAVWQAAESRWPRARAVLAGAALMGLAGLGVADVVAVLRAGEPVWVSPPTGDLADRLGGEFDPAGGELVVRAESSAGAFVLQGLVLRLEKDGFDARVPADSGGWFGDHRVSRAERAQARLLVLADFDLDGFVERPGLSLVAYSGSLPFEERVRAGAEKAAEYQAVLDAFEAGELTPADFERALREVEPLPTAVAVFRED